jgi:hypothetical protein
MEISPKIKQLTKNQVKNLKERDMNFTFQICKNSNYLNVLPWSEIPNLTILTESPSKMVK